LDKLIDFLSQEQTPAVWTALAAVVSVLLVVLVMSALRQVAVRLTSGYKVIGLIVRRTHRPTTVVVAVGALHAVLQAAPDSIRFIDGLRHANGVLWIGAVTWLLLRWVAVARLAAAELNPFDGPDNLLARSRLTQIRVLSRTLYVVILLVGMSAALMTFPSVRQLGASLLASAGIAGLAVGLAARPVLSNMLAGVQLALTQPIRIDDVLVLEGEWGRVEEITGAYVVVRIWDERRLIVPLQYFIERPFQNWTRTSAEILGTVMLWVDYQLPVDEIRAEVSRLCAQDKDWDGRVAIVQITDTDAHAMQLRVLLSSENSGRNFDLRCRIREALIAFVAHEHPDCLPRLRAEWPPAASQPVAGGAAPVAPPRDIDATKAG
jgi:small-conductance mechanosensitive channel